MDRRPDCIVIILTQLPICHLYRYRVPVSNIEPLIPTVQERFGGGADKLDVLRSLR